jgi:hypothetical protein
MLKRRYISRMDPRKMPSNGTRLIRIGTHEFDHIRLISCPPGGELQFDEARKADISKAITVTAKG